MQSGRRRLMGGFLGWTMTALGATAPALAWARSSTQPAMVSVGVSTSILREGPGLRHAGRWSVPRGYPLQVVRRQNGWLQVRDFEGDLAWVRAAATSRQPHLIVKVPSANLRARPSTGARVAGKLKYGTILRTQERRGDWVRVRPLPSGPSGWVAERLLWGF